MTCKARIHGMPYVTQLAGNSWHIVIPISGRLAPIILRCIEFDSQIAAEEWLQGDAGRELVKHVQVKRALPG